MCSESWRYYSWPSLLTIRLTGNALLLFALTVLVPWPLQVRFQAFVKNAAPQVIFSHCIIHRYMRLQLKNFLLRYEIYCRWWWRCIKSRATNCRIFRVLCEEMGRTMWISYITRRFGGCPMVRSWLIGISGVDLSSLEAAKPCVPGDSCLFEWLSLCSECLEPLQSNQPLMPIALDKIAAFKTKVELYRRRVNVGNKSVFPELTTLPDTAVDCAWLSGEDLQSPIRHTSYQGVLSRTGPT